MQTSEDVFDECIIKNFELTVKRLYQTAENFHHYTDDDGRITSLSCQVNCKHHVESIHHYPGEYLWFVHRETAGGHYEGYSKFSLEAALTDLQMTISKGIVRIETRGAEG